MPKYKWEVVFDADDDKDADAQCGAALGEFTSYHSENVELVEEDDRGESR